MVENAVNAAAESVIVGVPAASISLKLPVALPLLGVTEAV